MSYTKHPYTDRQRLLIRLDFYSIRPDLIHFAQRNLRTYFARSLVQRTFSSTSYFERRSRNRRISFTSSLPSFGPNTRSLFFASTLRVIARISLGRWSPFIFPRINRPANPKEQQRRNKRSKIFCPIFFRRQTAVRRRFSQTTSTWYSRRRRIGSSGAESS